ncbi:class I SAM-dependent methyltransferase [Rhodococcus aerolatus]
MTVAATPRPVTPLGILAATLVDVQRRLASVPGVDAGLAADVARAVELASGLDPYVTACTTPESPALAALEARTRSEDWAQARGETGLEQEMLSGHVEGQALKMLVHLCRARRVLDVGMFTGYSALAMAEALPDDGEVVACEVDAHVAAIAQECFDAAPDGGKITVRVAPALDTLDTLAAAGERFDLVFVDADKAGYADYLDRVLTGDLLAEHGVVCVDNTLMQGLPWRSDDASANGDAIAAFNAGLADDPRVAQVLLPLRDGLTLVRRA